MVLEVQQLLRAGDVHPIIGKPAIVVIRIPRPTPRHQSGHALGRRHCRPDVTLAQQVRLVAGDQQDLPDHIRFGGCNESRCDIAGIDAVNAAVGAAARC